MKKTIPILLAIVLVISVVLGSVPVLADATASGATLSVTASTATAKPGDEVTFTVALDCDAVQAMAIKIGDSFDASVFEFVSAEWLISGVLADVDTAALNAAIAFSAIQAVTEDVLRFTLRVKEDVEPADTTVNMQSVLKVQAEQVAVTSVGCRVSVDPNAPVDEGTLVSTQKYNNRLTFEVYEMADGSHKLVVSGTGVMPTNKQVAGYEFLNYKATIKSVVIEEGVTSVGYGIFNGWTALASVELSGTITTIDGESFRGCTGLKAIDIPDSVTTLGYGAFWGAGLESVVVPESVTSIKNYVFYRCKSLVSAEIYGTTDYKVGSRIYKAPGARMFSECSKLSNIVLGENINLLNTYCFHGTAITEFTVPARVKFVYDAAFHSCTKMTKFVMEEGVTYLGWAALFGCSSLTDVSLPSTITGGNIATWAFGACTSLESIELPAGLTNLKKRTFSGCTSLKSIELPETVTTLGDRVFIGCTALESVKLSNITKIDVQTFNNCPKLTSITIPETVTSIGSLAFRLNESLKTVYIDSATIAAGLTGNAVYGNMIKWAETIAIRSDITNVPSYVTSNYKTVGSVTVDGVEYVTYSK